LLDAASEKLTRLLKNGFRMEGRLTSAKLGNLSLAQGDRDAVVRPEVTQSYAAELCGAAQASTRAALSWISDRFAEAQPPNTCGALGNAR
jgi:hypothetical protein